MSLNDGVQKVIVAAFSRSIEHPEMLMLQEKRAVGYNNGRSVEIFTMLKKPEDSAASVLPLPELPPAY